jgi:hypothetical protein
MNLLGDTSAGIIGADQPTLPLRSDHRLRRGSVPELKRPDIFLVEINSVVQRLWVSVPLSQRSKAVVDWSTSRRRTSCWAPEQASTGRSGDR